MPLNLPTENIYGEHVSCDHSISGCKAVHSSRFVQESPHQPHPCGSLELTHAEQPEYTAQDWIGNRVI